MNRAWSKVRRAAAIIWAAVQAFIADSALTHGAAIAFYSMLSLAPILVLLIWITSALGPHVQDRLVDQVGTLVGKEGADVIHLVIENADRHVDIANLAGWISIGALLVSATAVFAQLQVALNSIWGVKPKVAGWGIAAWLRKRLLSLGLIVSFGFLLLVSLVVSSGLAALLSRFQDEMPGADVLWRLCDLILPFLIYLAMFMALFRYIPDAELRWRHVLFGGAVTAGLFVLGKFLIGLYLGTSALGSSYGAAGSLILTLSWAYYSAAIVLFGAELTQAYVREHGERIRAEEIAEPDHNPDKPGVQPAKPG